MPPSKTLKVCFPPRVNLSLVAAVTAVLACQPQTCATLLLWDTNPNQEDAQDGSGIWNTTNSNWLDLTNQQWRNAPPDSAIFGAGNGAAGIVTLGSNITVDDLTFDPAGSGNYTISGAGNTLTLQGTSIFGTAGATLNVNLAGTSGLIVHNAGTIRLGGANTYSGPTFVFGRMLQLDSPGALGNSGQINVGNAGAISTSSLVVNVPNTTSTTAGAGKNITIVGTGADGFGALRGADNASNTWASSINIGTVGSRISGGQSGTLDITGVINGGNFSPIIFSTNRNSTTRLNAVNQYTGDTRLFNNFPGTVSTLVIGVDNAIHPNSRLTAISTPSSGLQVVDLNGHALTFRSLDTSEATTAASSANLIVTNNNASPATLTVGDFTPFESAFGGSINNGVGALSLVKRGDNLQILGGANSYTGTTTVNGGILQLGGVPDSQDPDHFIGANAVLASTRYFLNAGQFVVDNRGTDNKNDARLPDTADLIFNGGDFHFQGTDSIGQNSSETIRNLTLNSGGRAEIRVSFGRVNAATFNANQLTRVATGPTAMIGGDSLGRDGTSTVNVVRFVLNTAPALVGTTAPLSSGINVNAKNTRIVPFLLGEANTSSGGVGSSNGTSNTFITYQAATGFRPLNPIDEFTNNAIVEGDNTRITQATTAPVSAAINSLVMAGSDLTISQTLTNTSGAILFSRANKISGGTINFGSAEGLITVNAVHPLDFGKIPVLSSNIAGSNGWTFNGPGSLELTSPNSTYTGNTTLRSGMLILQESSIGTPVAVTSGPLGRSTLTLAGGVLRGATSTPVTIGNAVVFREDTLVAQNGRALTFSGPVTLSGGSRTLFNDTSTSASTITFSGAIGDAGQGLGLSFFGLGASPVVLAGANTYTGPTKVLSGTVIVSGTLSGDSTTTVGDPAAPINTARLGGSGNLGDVIAIGSGNQATSGATVDPGDSANVAGIMRVDAFSLTNGAHLSMQIGGVAAGGENTTGHDRLVAGGSVTLTGGDLKLALLQPLPVPVGTQLFLIVNNSGASVAGTFATLNGAAFNQPDFLISGQPFALAYNGNFSGAGSDGIANDVVLVAIPEPGNGALVAGAFGLLISVRRLRGRISASH